MLDSVVVVVAAVDVAAVVSVDAEVSVDVVKVLDVATNAANAVALNKPTTTKTATPTARRAVRPIQYAFTALLRSVANARTPAVGGATLCC
jgi:hypothetical protein